MEKILKPKENYNPEKLCKEIKAKGIENRIWDLEASYKLEWEEGAEAVVPVSYTHLDVYKRQDGHHAQGVPGAV